MAPAPLRRRAARHRSQGRGLGVNRHRQRQGRPCGRRRRLRSGERRAGGRALSLTGRRSHPGDRG
eukprot:7993739-Lingulodinium_polyedra.AAC.1